MFLMSATEPAKLLLERWRTGDQAAAEQLFLRYSQRLHALAERRISERLARRVGPEDIVQSVFRTFFRRTGEGQFAIDHSGSLWRLLVQITLFKIRGQHQRHHAARRDLSAELQAAPGEQQVEALARDPSPEEAAALNDELEAALAGLEPAEQEMLRLCLQGHSPSEIATQVGCSRWTVRRVLDRIGNRLQRRLHPDSAD